MTGFRLPLGSFRRVTVKGVILDQDRLLVVQHRAGHYEMPGGGWRHNETREQCLRREMREEVGVQPDSVDERIRFEYSGYGRLLGCVTTRLAVVATLPKPAEGFTFVCGDGMIAARFVTQQEFKELPFSPSEAGVLTFADQIWAK